MSDVGIRQAGQSDSRKGSARDHDIAGDTGELAVSGFEIGAGDERRKLDHSSANAAQAGIGGDDERGSGPAADELFVNQERAESVWGLSAGIRRDH